MPREPTDLILKALGALGGVGVIVICFFRWGGAILSDRFRESARAKTEKDLEVNRQRLGVSRIRADRYAASQFEIYHQLWTSLQELREKGQNLWENVDAKNITSFAEQLSQIKIAIRDGAIFFDDDDYLELQSLVHAFGAFGAGKNLIAHLESPLLLDEHDLSAWRRRVYQNRQLKDEYEALLEKIRISFRRQLSSLEERS